MRVKTLPLFELGLVRVGLGDVAGDIVTRITA